MVVGGAKHDNRGLPGASTGPSAPYYIKPFRPKSRALIFATVALFVVARALSSWRGF
jgi:hypothetical protein